MSIVWTGILKRIGLACIAGLLIALLLIPLLPEADVHSETMMEAETIAADEEQEEPLPEKEIHVTRVEAVEIPEITVTQESPDTMEEAVTEAKATQMPAQEELAPLADKPPPAEDMAANEPEAAQPTTSPPEDQPAYAAPELQEDEPADVATTQTVMAPERISLSSQEMDVFIRTQTVNNRAKSFPRIHIAYANVDVRAQLNFYKSRGYGFFAVEMESGVISKLLGKIDIDTRRLSAIDGRDGLAWNYGSVIMKYRQMATESASNPNAYLAVVPTYDVANLILGSIDKALNGVIDGDYRNYQSYRAVFTTRGRDAVLTVLIPSGNSFIRREILLNRSV